MKRLIVLVLWALVATPTRADLDLAVLMGLNASVLKIEVLRVQGGVSLGSGVVIAAETIATNCHVIQSSNGFSSGASGGGLFDEHLRLVGILTFRLPGGQAHYFAAPAEWLQAMLDAPGQAGYSGVVPDRSAKPAYWQRPVRAQPRFLKAALLQRDNRWPELASLATEWARADASDPEPWYQMGMAQAQMNRLPEAQHALECSLTIEPTSTATWARLAPVYERQGLTERASQIESGLSNPNSPPDRSMLPAMSPSAPCAMGAPASRLP